MVSVDVKPHVSLRDKVEQRQQGNEYDECDCSAAYLKNLYTDLFEAPVDFPYD